MRQKWYMESRHVTVGKRELCKRFKTQTTETCLQIFHVFVAFAKIFLSSFVCKVAMALSSSLSRSLSLPRKPPSDQIQGVGVDREGWSSVAMNDLDSKGDKRLVQMKTTSSPTNLVFLPPSQSPEQLPGLLGRREEPLAEVQVG